ncbi:hypothetical protein [Bradyrhizobium mercantei]|uniref:hypothetical protein n=1 Tax=Bradyrhizobium mercantei TaxID=1904807 RepID=UPI000977B205|nr:hypothetical protein [Bradyrhizobium mercantei]
MKSYFLEELGEVSLVRSELSAVLPRQVDPWLLLADDETPVAYFSIADATDGGSCVQADMSGRHFHQDELVLSVLRKLQARLGGVIRDDEL